MPSDKGYKCKCGEIFPDSKLLGKHFITIGRREKGKHGSAGRVEVEQVVSQATEAPGKTVVADKREVAKLVTTVTASKLGVKKILPFTPWKMILGLALIVISFPAGAIYFANVKNMFAALIMIFTFAPGAYFVYSGFQVKTKGFLFQSAKKPTGKENAVILFARKDNGGLDVPVGIHFVELTNPPKGARLHYFCNYKRHYFELFNNTKTKKLEPVVLPDKKAFPPGLFQVPAAMQTYKDAIDYSPPTLFQKLAPGILLIAMAIIGILMVMTTTNTGG